MAVRGKGFVRLRFQKRTKKRLRELKRQGQDLTPVMRVIQTDLIRSTHLNFIRSGRKNDASGIWKPHSPVTVERRRSGQKKGGAKPQILRDTGRLFDSIQKPGGNRVGSNFTEVGTNVEYAEDHQQGGNFSGSIQVNERIRIPEHKRKQKVRNKRGKLVTKTVTVKAHTQQVNHRLPARPFLFIHRKDRARAQKRVSDWVTRQKKRSGGNSNTRGGVGGR